MIYRIISLVLVLTAFAGSALADWNRIGGTNNVSLYELQILYPLTSFPAVTGPNAEWLADNGWEVYVPPAPAAPTNDQIAAQMEAQFCAFLDAKAQEKGFTNRSTLMERASFPGYWHDTAVAFGVWVDACEGVARTIKADCLAGTRTAPTFDEFIAAMPVLVWP